MVSGKLPESIQREAQAAQEDLETGNWFRRDEKGRHEYYMEHIMSLGLPFLTRLLTADRPDQANILLGQGTRAWAFSSDTLKEVEGFERGERRPSFFPCELSKTTQISRALGGFIFRRACGPLALDVATVKARKIGATSFGLSQGSKLLEFSTVSEFYSLDFKDHVLLSGWTVTAGFARKPSGTGAAT